VNGRICPQHPGVQSACPLAEAASSGDVPQLAPGLSYPLAKDRDLRWTVGTGPRGFNRSFKGSAYRDADIDVPQDWRT
jgi:hypothetical protein